MDQPTTSGSETPVESGVAFAPSEPPEPGAAPAASAPVATTWSRRLEGVPALLDLPADRPRRAGRERERGLARESIPPSLSRRLETDGPGLAESVLGAYSLLLGRYASEEVFVVGVLRESGDAGEEPGPVPARVDLAGDPSFRALAARLEGAASEAWAHRDVSSWEWAAALHPGGVPDGHPVFQAVFARGGGAPGARRLQGIRVAGAARPDAAPGPDLALELRVTDEGAVVELSYAADRFTPETAARVLRHLRVLLEAAAADPDAPVSSLPLMDAEERARVLEGWNATDRPLPTVPVHRAFEEHARRDPGAPAVLGSAPLTYGELDARANRLAHLLVRRGVGPEVRVGVCLERSPELVVAVLAVLKAGGAYVPLDPALPAERIGFMAADTGLGIVLAAAATESRLPAGVEVVRLDTGADPAAGESEEAPAPRLTPANAAYVIYTSGSTGTPKGVVVEHGSLANLAAWHVRAFGVTAGDRATLLAGLGFDASVWELWPYLSAGASVLPVDDATRADPAALRGLLLGSGVSVAFAPTPLAEALLALEWPADAPLRHLLAGGDVLATHPRTDLPFALVNNYGPTECAVVATSGPVPPAGDGEAERLPGIGAPVDNARAYVLDGRGEPVPAGVAGELYVGGAGVARGYLGRPDLTSERFVPDPFGSASGARFYRTGDRVRRRADGEVEFLGRIDQQVKVRGFRIEPEEVSGALERHPAVARAVVVPRPDATGEKRLVAYFVAAGVPATSADLRAWLAGSLPDFMVPAAYVALDAFPLTPNGKVDRRALPEPDFGSAAYLAPRTPAEEVMAGLFAEVLGVERVGVDDDFFAAGGHSLRATRLAARIREAFGAEVPVPAVFEAPTVAALAAHVETVLREDAGGRVPPVVPVPRDGALPLSFAQQRLWFIQQMDPSDTGYNVPFPLRLRGPLDAGALRRALGEVVRRHEALRTTFAAAPGGAVQVIHPGAALRLPVVDLGGLRADGRERELGRLEADEGATPFDLGRGPVFRASLVRLAADDAALLLGMHHIVSDGWSMGLLFRELSALYDAFARGEPSPLPELPVQYADFAVWQRARLSGETLRRHLGWWRDRLRGASPMLELPTDRPRPAVVSGRGEVQPFRVPAAAARALRALARREGATLYMVALAAFDALLARWSGQEDVVVGSPIANRTRREVEGLIGFFVNTLALRGDLAGNPEFSAFLARVRDGTLGAYAHQDLPFERLVEEIAPDRSLSHTPLFQVMFALQNTPGEEEGPVLSGLRIAPLRADAREGRFLGIRNALFDLEMELVEDGDELAGSLRYRTDLFDASTVARMAEHYRVLLTSVAREPDARVFLLPMLPEAELRLLADFGTGPERAAGFAPAHLRVAERAALSPGAPAVRFGGASLSHGELRARVVALAGRLREAGVVRGTRVAVHVERGPGILVGMLATWEAGGVYLPLDPSYPAERLAFLLADSGAGVVLTEPHLSLPEHGARTVHLDPPASGDPGTSPAVPAVETAPGDLAYLIYTSGSTGTPKAVMVAHGQLAHTLDGALDTLRFAADDVVASLASVAFDISLLELLCPLVAGGSVRVVPRAEVQDADALVEAVRDVTVLHAVPALMRQVVDRAADGVLPRLRTLLVGGDLVPPDLLEAMRGTFPAARTHVLYGPTEGTIICATWEVPASGPVEGHPVGRPLPGVRLRVLDAHGQPVPVSVPGEIGISGGGVTLGYLGRPEQTAAQFVSRGGERAYRTGDRARWRPDGVLEFLGRVDAQVKVRGFRIEPGEVEAALRASPGVREAVVLAREDVPGEKRLVAYVVPEGAEAERATEESAVEQVAGWETVFEETYGEGESVEDPTLNLTGWNSSYTGRPIPEAEMREWVERTVERILDLRPERVLEIGCGTGLLLFRVAPHARHYHGTDFSRVALEFVGRHLKPLPQVRLSVREADRLDGLAEEAFDTVVLNSVSQYFPGVDYLLRVLEGAAAVLRPGGRIFVGDVRSLPLLGAFHASVEGFRAPDDLPAATLRARVRRGMAEEQELLVEPAFFEALRARIPRIGRVEVQVKRDGHDNEVSRFRYDAVLHLDGEAARTEPQVRRWGGEDVDALRGVLSESDSGRALAVLGVPDARVAPHVRAAELLAGGSVATAGELRAALANAGGGVRPEALFILADELGRRVEVRPGAAGSLDVLFHAAGRDDAAFPAAEAEPQPWEAYANDPQWGRRMRHLVPALRTGLRDRLPEYMVPSAFVVLEAFPVTSNGKVDRAALPAPDVAGGARAYMPPRTVLEERLAAVWAEVLGVERVGVEESFFDLGGHSLLATQVMSRVREALGVEVPLRALFEAPTVAGLAERVEAARAAGSEGGEGPPLVPAPRDGSLPLSFAQQRLWFIERMEPGNPVYNVPTLLRLRGDLDAAALERALEEIVRRHESLRTVFDEVDGAPVQVILPAGAVPLPVLDLSGVPAEEREARAMRRIEEEVRRPYDLRTGPMMRTLLARLDGEDALLLVCMHHVVSDAWSMGVLFRELSALYGAFARGEPSPLPEPEVQYADFAVWQRAWLRGPVLDAQLGYWTERLRGAPPVLELPTDRPRPAVRTGEGAVTFRLVPREAADALRALAHREGATPYMVLLAAFDALLARWSGEEDVVVGTPIANRNRREVEGLIGFFVNTLALRVDVSGNPSFRALLGRVKEATLGAYAHQDLPFERLVEALKVERSLAHTPVFQVAFSLEDAATARASLPGLAVEELHPDEEVSEYDLGLRVQERPDGLGLLLHYRPELFDAATVARMLDGYELLLRAAAGDAGRAILDLPLVADADRARLREWSAGGPQEGAGTIGGACLHERFAARAALAPDAPALVCGAETLTYAELDARAERLADALRRRGVGPEVRVAVCLERGPEAAVALLGVLKAGGVYVPLDPESPPERLAYVLADAGARVRVTQASLAARLGEPGADTLLVDALEAPGADAEEPRRTAAPHLDPRNLAYLIYTSGSTGRPKGVAVEHRAAAAHLESFARVLELSPADRVLHFAALGFDVSIEQFFLPLLSGAAVVMRGPEPWHPAEWPARVRELGITVANLPPAFWQEIVEAGAACALPELRLLLVGADAMPAGTVRRWRDAVDTPARLLNAYGPTETVVTATAFSLPGDYPAGYPGATVPVGSPLPGRTAHVLDPAGGPVPPGVPGELYLGGDLLARGYPGRAGLTAERFVPDPFAAESGARLYRTGDRVRWLATGALEFLGRVDRQVKVRGFRVEPGEIEAVLAEHPAVREAAVVVREGPDGNGRLVAYVVAAGTETVDADALRERVARALPAYMVPSAWVFLDALPRTASGKTDRAALPAPELSAPAADAEPPRTPTERALAAIWSGVLGVEVVGIRQNFFALGGHSLLATRVVSRVREALGVELPLRAAFEAQTLAELAARADAERAAGPAATLPTIEPARRDGPLPLSFGQERLWLLHRLDPASVAYNMPFFLRLRGLLDVEALRGALAAMVERHESLRTTFPAVEGHPVQEVAPFRGFALPVEDLSGLGDAEREAAARARTHDAALRPFDLAAGPLFHASLHRLGAEDHLLVLALHHVVADGWSLGVLFSEIPAVYEALSRGEPSPLAPPALQYADFAAWQRDRLSGPALDAQLAYWRDRLSGAPPLLELPTDRPRPAVPDLRRAVLPFTLSPADAEGLRGLARRHGATPFMAALAAVQALLSRYSGRDDVPVGTPVAGRTRAETEALVGFFVNTLVLRADLSADPSAGALVEQARTRVLEAQANQDLPFERLVEALGVERSLAYNPVFQVTFTLEAASERAALRLPGVEVETATATGGETPFDLTVALAEEADGTFAGEIDYRAALFDAGTVERMAGHLRALLAAMAARPELPVSELPLLSGDERTQLLATLNATAEEFPEGCVHEWVAARAALTPGAPAVTRGAEVVTYAELCSRADAVAGSLRGLGVGPETRVAVCLERSTEMVVALLGVLEAGCAYVPLDPEYPADRLAYMLGDCGARVLLTHSALAGRLPAFAGEVVRVDAGLPAPRPAGGDAAGRVSPDHLAYVIYTSGSTGRPKGVGVPHGALANHMAWMQRDYPLSAGDRVLQKTPFSFDASVWEFWAPLLAGATLVMAEPGAHREPARLAAAMADERITVAQFVPALLNALLDEELAGCAAVRRVFCGGEALPAEVAARCRAALGAEVVNLYGPTEACIDAVAGVAAPARAGATVPIGRPVANVRAYVLDPAGAPAPLGVPGELFLGGAGLARGYLGRPDLTAERFVPDPFAPAPGGRLYRTGDLVRWLASGEMEFLGRTDAQVKVRGFRIEPGEVEGALAEHPAVREAAVVVRGVEAGAPRLVAYVTPSSASPVKEKALREFVRGRVPDYMVPSAFVVLDAFPLTPSGKVDRAALPDPDLSADDGYTAPSTPAEEVMAGVWAEVLGLERVGRLDDFFALGGHSLLATRVVSRVRRALGVELPLRAVFEAPTVAGLAARAETLLRAGPTVEAPPVVPVPRDRALPLSFSQQRLWLLDRLEPGSAAYNVPMPLRVRGPLDASALRAALGEVVRRHEVLRSRFPAPHGEPVLAIDPPTAFPLPAVDLVRLRPEDADAESRRLVHAETLRPFDLAAGPLVRASLVRLGAEDSVLLLAMHHGVSDAWSADVLAAELSELYGAFSRGEPSPLPELPVQYADFAAWQREWLSGDVLGGQLAWWRGRLAGAPPLLELPTDRPRVPLRDAPAATVDFVVPAATADALSALRAREGATLFMTYLAAWQALLARYAGQDDVVVGTPVAGRTRAETEGLIGFFVNTLVLRADVSRDPSFRALLGEVREGTLGAFANQDLPFERLVEEIHPDRTPGRTPVFQVLFSAETAAPAAIALGAARVEPVDPGPVPAKVDLALGVSSAGGAVRGSLAYRADLWEPATLERMAGHFVHLLAGVAADPDRPLSSVPLLDASERARVLDASGTADAAEATRDPVHDLFVAQAARTPDAVAVEHGAESLSYAELERRSARLAARLRALGVGPEARVGVCLERSPGLLVAVLATLRAGGAYVPLDPGYPSERLARVLEDAAVSVVLADAASAALLPEHGAHVVMVGAAVTDTAEYDGAAPGTGASPENAAYVIHTSGSTGAPRGVVVEHRSFAALLDSARGLLDIGPGDVVPVLASYAFDIWGFEALAPLLRGATLRIVPAEVVKDPSRLVETLRGAAVVHAVPALMRQVAAAAADTGPLDGVRRVFVGGDAVPPDLFPEIRSAFPDAEARVLYGPTEATVLASAQRVRPDEPVAGSLLGLPLPHATAYVLDGAGEPVPFGVPGELYLGGAGVARGYLGRPELTAVRFVPDPFGGAPGARLYRTGDRARLRPDGALEFLGRLDRQVKIRGFRIEPGEVEAALERHPGVREAVVVARGTGAERRLVAYLTAAREVEAPTADALRAFLREGLPEYMVPGALVVLDALPLTPTGKVDRGALPEPGDAPGDAAPATPRTPAEETMAGIWAQALGVERVGIHSDFFALGGHSLAAARVAARVREVFGVELPLRALFEASTVAALTARVEAQRRVSANAPPPPLVRVPRDPGSPLPLSFAQQRLWFVERMEPGSAQYNIPYPLRLRGPLDPVALRGAVEFVTERHEALRTVFAETDEGSAQVILPPAPARLPVVDLGALPEHAREAEVQRIAGDDTLHPFDLARGPLLRTTLLRLAPGEAALLLTQHHVASDGWSTGVLTRELSAAYAALVEGRRPSLPELPLQYADYAVWQRRWLSGETLDRQVAWWKAQLAGAPPLLDLPTDRPRGAVKDGRGHIRETVLPAPLSAALRGLSRREGATPFMTFLAAWQALLGRYAGQDDVVVGSPTAGRSHVELEGLIGIFLNTLALRVDLAGAPSFRALLGRVRETTLGAYAHQEVPFEKLVEELGIERSLHHTPVFQVVVSLQNMDRVELRLGGVEAEWIASGRLSARFDLVLTITEEAGRFAAGITFRSDLWDAATVERMLGHLGRLLEGACADPEARVAEIPLLDAGELRQVLAAPAAVPVSGRPVHERIAEQAGRTPDAVAVDAAGERLTYAELDARANRLAHRLRALGVGPDGRVALLLERSAAQVAAVLGILRAGGAYLALDPSYPDDRLLYMLGDAGASAVVTDAALSGRLAGFAGAAVRLDADAEALAREPDHAPAVPVDPENLAYVIYTSGSTGEPKGVLVTHRGLSDYLEWFERTVLAGERFALPMVSRLGFDAHVRQIFPPLLHGGAVWVLPEAVATDPSALLEALGSREPVSFGGVPSLWGAVLDALQAGEHPAPGGLRAVLLGGEALPPELVRRTRIHFPDARIWNHYGPTEATVNTTVALVEDAERVTLGAPVAHARVYLLDPACGPVPLGVPGELYVGGTGVSRGYLGRPDLTAERFVPDPFSGVPGARMYRSGDRVRRRADGELEYLGRTDGQVKVRGFRIELGEVEAALAAHSDVGEAAARVREDEPGERRLVAYVVPSGDGTPGVAELREWLARRLPEYMVPAAFVVLEELPLTRNGKVDRKALPAPDAVDGEDGFVPPRTHTEEVLAGIWAGVVKAGRVGARDDFFALGGHSLSATVVVSRVRRVFRVELPLRAVFEAPTLAGLAERVDALLRAGEGTELPPIVPVPHEARGALPLSFSQQRLWFIDQMDPGTPAYNLLFPLRLKGALEVVPLRRAFAEVSRRHEVLRTRFPLVDGEPVQVVEAPAPFALPVADLAAFPAEARDREVLRLAEAENLRGFDLARGPLLRAQLLRLDDREWVLLLTVHHVVYDGWSGGVLFRELSVLYDAFRKGAGSPLPELPVQYGDYAAWQRAWLTGEALERQLAWWRGRLAGAPPLLELPTDRPRAPVPDPRSTFLGVEVSGETADAVRALSRREGATPFMTLLSAWQAVLARYAGEEDVVVGSPIAGRTRHETEELIGFFVNTLALRTDLSGDPAFEALLGRVREATLGAYAHQDIPFERLVDELGVERSLTHSPVFQVMFALQNQHRDALRLGGVAMETLQAGAGLSGVDLGLNVLERDGGGMTVVLAFRRDLWEVSTAERLLGHYLRLLDGILSDPSAPLSTVDLLAPGERAQLLAAGEEPRPAASLHDLFAAQARRTPDAPALVAGAETLTYRELEGRAGRIARRLRALGVGPEVRVGICLERGVEMVASILGVHAAGGAYVPLDPLYPAERLAFMLHDSGATVLVTRESLRGTLPEFGGAVVSLDAPWPEDADGGDAPLDGPAAPENLAYVIYTSGSTGRPKGVLVEHASAANLLCSAADAFGVRPGDRHLQAASVSFDASVLEIFLALLNGGTLHVVDPEAVLSPDALAALLREREIDVWVSTPALLEALPVTDLPALRAVSTGGDRCSGALAARWSAGRLLLNCYGPTETTIYATAHLCDPGSAAPPPIGRPAAATRAYVLDERGGLVTPGVPGELYLGGPGVTRGYHGRPELTAERFVPDAFSDRPGARLYRTGDRVRRLGDGTLEFLGRADAQVKIRGFRIEPGEVEAALALHPEVREAVTVVRGEGAGRHLVAFVVPAEGAAPSPAELRDHVRASLPEHMVPAAVALLDRLPLTPGGKVDRRALPAVDVAAEEYVAPGTPTEEALARIWAEVLELERVGLGQGFFALGGHSLLATRVVSRIRADFGIELPVRALFEAQTVEALAARVDAEVRAGVEDWELAEELERLDQLSDEDILRLLNDL